MNINAGELKNSQHSINIGTTLKFKCISFSFLFEGEYAFVMLEIGNAEGLCEIYKRENNYLA